MAGVSSRRSGRMFALACLCIAAACGMLQCSLGSISLLAAVKAGEPTAADMQAAYAQAAQIYAYVHQQHKNTIAKVSAILAIKIVLLHLLSARTRVMLGNFKRSTNAAQPWEEDERVPAWFTSVMKVILVCVGPAPSEAFLTRLQGLVANTMETEPWFIGLAVAYGLRGVTSIYAVKYAQKLMW
eukprot:CAMPEP_0115467258 /NCGR_PEP_ID=MMETSP0271-20121206/50348_1 /TAXON_ID=71861 /ORGANISM="Scrippsiella trochoidea, Strain CCMP3099" /LENGTH=183 /DNA_ID=CAMNT_0002894273 /DNA_START=64 /DNA_END=612 /DNA_ORIENTATION=+